MYEPPREGLNGKPCTLPVTLRIRLGEQVLVVYFPCLVQLKHLASLHTSNAPAREHELIGPSDQRRQLARADFGPLICILMDKGVGP